MNELYWSNQKSILQHILKERDVNPYIYDYNNNFSNGIKVSYFFYPENENYSFGDIVKFNVEKYGHLAKLFIEINFTLDAEYTLGAGRAGERFFEWTEVRAKNGDDTIQRFSDTYTLLRTDMLDQSTFTRMTVLTEPYLINNTTHAYRMYCPIYAYFSEHPSKFLNTEVIEPIAIHAKINKDIASMGINENITSMSFKLHATYFKTEYLETLHLPLTYVVSQSFEELDSRDITAGESSFRGVFEVDRSVFSTHFILENERKDIQDINSVVIKVYGHEVYTSNSQLNAMELGWYGTSGFDLDSVSPSTNLGSRAFTIYWSMYSDRNRNTLMNNFKDCAPVEYEITFDTIVSGDVPPYKLKIVHEYFDLLKVDEKGRFERRIIY